MTAILTSSARMIQAVSFFHGAHDSIQQVRKYTGEPYHVHTDEVTEISHNAGVSEDGSVVAQGHDYEEDVIPKNPAYTMAMVVDLFGQRVADGIHALTDIYIPENFGTWNRARRKKAEAERLGTIDAEWQTIKLADLISNGSDIVRNNPAFAKTYLREKEFLLTFLTKGDRDLWNSAWTQLQENLEKLGMEARITLKQVVF